MPTAASWTCDSCQTLNPPTRAACERCGARRIVDLTPGTPTTPTAHKQPPTTFTPPTTLTKPPTPTRPAPTQPPMAVVTPISGGPGTVVPPRSPAGTPPVDHGVTRYLCCAMQLDAALARKAVEHVLEEPRRAIASSPGVDLSCVLAYALAARSRQLARDCLLALILVVTLIGTVIEGPPFLLLGLLIAWALVAAELFYVHYGVIVPKLSRDTFDPAAAPTPATPHQASLLRDIARRDNGNVTVFQGFAPFAGYGQSMETWSFAVRTDTPREDADAVRPFTVHALYDHLATAVEALRLPGVRVQDRLFVNGQDLRVHLDATTGDALLPDPEEAPQPSAPHRLLHDLREDGSGRARPYLTLLVSGWDGELVSTQFLRLSLLPDQGVLFVENSTSLLAPVRADYRSVDTLLDRPTFRQAAATVASALPRAIGLLISSFPAVYGTARHALGQALGFKDRRQLREIRHLSFDYGAPISLREAASDQLYYRYYQKVDREMYTKVVSRRVLDGLVEFLEAHDIDTSELRERQTTIYNNGLYVGANANVSVSQSAVAAGRNAVGRMFSGAGARTGGGSSGRG
ncbi:zinc finger Ran-binding domain-containing protein [Kitasatospora sp. NPDC058162]|uniref:zinc finger Ran-binding domain-containing protein n=1 Tax=Kitasatospora sp. NPDC058162 TaxID=3346362 RepID=UPI0036DDA174